jgi:hypothetical protein
MKSKWLKVTAAVVAFLLAAVVIMWTVSSVWAQGPQNGMNRFGNQASMHQSAFGGRFVGQGETLATVAKTLNMTLADVQSALQSGKTVADLAKAKNIALTKVVDALLAERQAALKAAVTAKQITQAKADQILANMKANLPEHLTSAFTPRTMQANGPRIGMQGGAGRWHMSAGHGGMGQGMGSQNRFGSWGETENNTQPNQ